MKASVFFFLACGILLIGCGETVENTQPPQNSAGDGMTSKPTFSRSNQSTGKKVLPKTADTPIRKRVPKKQPKKLTLEVVQRYLRNEKIQGKQIYTASYSTIDDAAAERLTQHDGPLFLNGLIELSESAAQSLAKHKHMLNLTGLVNLPATVAEKLGQHEGVLVLDGLTELPESVAEKLGQHKGGPRHGLYLSGLTAMTDAALENLIKSTGGLTLNGLKKLTDRQAAILSKHDGNLTLDGLSVLTGAQAESLGQHRKQLRLNGLTDLPEAVAVGLCKHQAGSLVSLNGVKTLSDQTAEHFSHIKCTFYLEGLVNLSDKASQCLGKRNTLLNVSDELRQRIKRE